MSTSLFVTSFSKDGQDIYGNRFLETFRRHNDYDLCVYKEPDVVVPDNIPDMSFPDLFMDKIFHKLEIENIMAASNLIPALQGKGFDKYNYRFDLARFIRKMAAQIHAYEKYSGTYQYIYWIDADTEWFGPVTEEYLAGQWADNAMLVMRRKGWHSCSSFVGWNMQHPKTREFFTAYRNMLATGAVLILDEWHDSFVLDFVVNQLNIPFTDLGAPFQFDGPFNVFDHVFEGTAKHYKGNLKKQNKMKGPQRYQQLIDIVTQTKPANVLEIGVHNGNRAIEIIRAGQVSMYVGADLFEDATSETDEQEKNVKSHCSVDSVSNHISKNVGMCYVRLVKGNTRETLPVKMALPGQEPKVMTFDLIFIDGGHSVETIRSDLDNARKMLSPGGVIILDDWYEGMPEGHNEKFGCNVPLQESGLKFEVLPIADPVFGGGVTKMAVIYA